MKKCLLSLVVSAVSVLAFGEASVSQVVVRQNWPWNEMIHVDFIVAGIASGTAKDVSLNLYNGETFLGAAPVSALSGDAYGLDHDDAYRVTIDPKKVPALAGTKALTNFRVEPVLTASAAAEVLYKIVDIATGEMTDVTEGQIRRGVYGAYEVNPVSTNGIAIESLVWTGVTNDVYKTTKMVFRRVKAGTFNMGYSAEDAVGRDTTREKPAFPVRLTKDYYIGVYPVTQRQLKEITGSYRSNASFRQDRELRPQETISYCEIRGDRAGCDWPTDGFQVASTSFVGVARAKLKVETLDLPTGAQWEYACRAGTTGAYNDGTPAAAEKTEDANLNRLGRYKYNGGCVPETWEKYTSATATDTSMATPAVGSYRPNAWGLYDMHGGVREMTLDWFANDYGYADSLDAQGVAVDPKGPTEGNSRNRVGGSHEDEPGCSRSAYRSYGSETAKNANCGFRLVIQPVGE